MPAGDRLHRTVFDRPAVFGQVPAPEQHVEERRMGRVVLVDGLGVRGVMPVVELRGDDHLAQPRFWQGGGETYHSGLGISIRD
jgi:hypothetical protein